MVKSAEVRGGDDLTDTILNKPRFRSVSLDVEMTPSLIVVALIRQKSSQQVAFANRDDVIRALPPNRTDDPHPSATPRGRSDGEVRRGARWR